MDIVKRLRAQALPDPHDEREVMHAPLLMDAANEIETLRVTLAAILSGDVGRQTLAKLATGQSTDTDDGRAWMRAALMVTPNVAGSTRESGSS